MNGNDEITKELPYTNAEAIAEALLFAAGESVEITDAANVLMLSKEETEKLLDKLAAKINGRNGGIILRKMDSAYRLSTRPDLFECLRVYFERPQSQILSRAASETLAVIAYMQPVTRSVIESVRGVNSDSALARLIERGLVCEMGKSEAPGRPTLYGTTQLFLQSTGISSLDELPKPETDDEKDKIEKINMFGSENKNKDEENTEKAE